MFFLKKSQMQNSLCQSQVLHSFQEPHALSLQLTGALSQSRTALQVQYSLSGQIDQVLLSALKSIPCRRDNLWQTTCFELFFAVQGSPQYWEVNLAPSGDWNVYTFTGYRQGMKEEKAITSLPCGQSCSTDRYQLVVDVPLAALVAPNQSLELALCAVLEINGQRHFYALTHHGSQPDFHARESFVINIEQ